jgi:hypothetical protein
MGASGVSAVTLEIGAVRWSSRMARQNAQVSSMKLQKESNAVQIGAHRRHTPQPRSSSCPPHSGHK